MQEFCVDKPACLSGPRLRREASRQAVGLAGENKAVDYLKKNGYKIITRNFRNKLGEIDIIAKDKGVVCFVEVRARQGDFAHQKALESVGWIKQKKLSKLAVSFLRQNKLMEQSARFDVVSVALSECIDSVVLIKNAFPVIDRYA